jgi:hypothetical protein
VRAPRGEPRTTPCPHVYVAGFLIGTGPPPGADLWTGAFLLPLESPTSFTSVSS